MPNKYVNKVVIGKETKLDLTADTITPDKLAKGITAHDKSGAPITGTSTKDADTSDATAAVAEVLFLSTLSLRRATAKVHKTVGHFCAYETNFMGIASSC